MEWQRRIPFKNKGGMSSNNNDGSASSSGSNKRKLSDGESNLIHRVLEMRKRQCARLDDAVVRGIAQGVSRERLGLDRNGSDDMNSRDELEAFLKKGFERASDPELPHNARRVSLQTVQDLLGKIDRAFRKFEEENPPISELPNSTQRRLDTQTSRQIIRQSSNSERQQRRTSASHASQPTSSHPLPDTQVPRTAERQNQADASASSALNSEPQQTGATSSPKASPPASQHATQQQAQKRQSFKLHLSLARSASSNSATPRSASLTEPANGNRRSVQENAAESNPPRRSTGGGVPDQRNSSRSSSLSSFVDKAKRTNDALDATSINNVLPRGKPEALAARSGSNTLSTRVMPKTNGNTKNAPPPPYTQASNVVTSTVAQHSGVPGRRLSAPTPLTNGNTNASPSPYNRASSSAASVAAHHSGVEGRRLSTPTDNNALAADAAPVATGSRPAHTSSQRQGNESATSAHIEQRIGSEGEPRAARAISLAAEQLSGITADLVAPSNSRTYQNSSAENSIYGKHGVGSSGRLNADMSGSGSGPATLSQTLRASSSDFSPPRTSNFLGNPNGGANDVTIQQATANNHHNSGPNTASSSQTRQSQPTEEPRYDKKMTQVLFRKDEASKHCASKYSGSLKERNNAKCSFRREYPTTQMNQEFGRRLQTWDPFWLSKHLVISGVTVSVDIVEPRGREPRPTFAFSCSFKLNERQIKLVKSWGETQPEKVQNGEWRLICRMLPLKPNTKKRADCHLWPKGTYLVLNDKPVEITQRKQQSHDLKLWKGMCNALDLTGYIRDPSERAGLHMCCYDEEKYMIVIAVCQYQSSEYIFRSLVQNIQSPLSKLQMVSYDDSMNRVMQITSQQTMVIDSDDENEEGDHGKASFSLICPVSKQIMNTPVRGRNCKHFQVRNKYLNMFSMP